MVLLIYTLCAITSLLCSILLLRRYSQSRYRLLYWAGLCFAGITVNNALLIIDKLLFPHVDLLTLRLSVTFIALMFLLYGLIFDE